MSSTNKSWDDCEPGVIGQMVSVQQTAKSEVSRRRALNVIAAGSVGCVAAFVYARSGRPKATPATQIACSKVHEKLQDFVDNKIADRYLLGVISRHLFVCADCQKAYQGMIDGDDFLCGNEQQEA